MAEKNSSSEIRKTAKRLNRLHNLYTLARNDKQYKPYRIGRLRWYLDNLIEEVSRQYEVIELTGDNFSQYFPETESPLAQLRKFKIEAAEKSDYERISGVSKEENKIMQEYLDQAGFQLNTLYFTYNDIIFKRW